MSQAHVLVVDDDPAVRDVLQEVLRQEEYSVSTAEDGAAAIQAVKDSVIHIVITDFQLPDIDGLEIIDRLAKLDAKIIPIMMTVWIGRSARNPSTSFSSASISSLTDSAASGSGR